jgi:hypothetical protein
MKATIFAPLVVKTAIIFSMNWCTLFLGQSLCILCSPTDCEKQAMNPNDTQKVPVLGEPGCQASEIQIAQLVAQVYETAPPAVRVNLLERLLKPLGVLSLMAVADGIFAKIRFSSGWPHTQIRFEDAQKVQAKDVIALVERVQKVSVNSVDGLAKMLTSSPVVAGSAAAALLVAVLVQRARTRREGDREANDVLVAAARSPAPTTQPPQPGWYSRLTAGFLAYRLTAKGIRFYTASDMVWSAVDRRTGLTVWRLTPVPIAHR